jgi:hypothetical protein
VKLFSAMSNRLQVRGSPPSSAFTGESMRLHG